jgi:site-specific recombinase XerD
MDAFETAMLIKGNASTAKTYRKRLRVFLQWLTDEKAKHEWGVALIQHYWIFLRQQLLSDLTRNGYLVAVRRFGAFLQSLGYADHNPAEHVKGWRTERTHRRQHLPVTDAKRFLEALENDRTKTPEQRMRDTTIGYLMIKTGLREIEVSRARLRGLSLVEGGWRLYVQGKGHSEEDEYVRLMPEVWDRISGYLHIRGVEPDGDGPLFVTVESRNPSGAVLQRPGLRIGTRRIQRVLTNAQA